MIHRFLLFTLAALAPLPAVATPIGADAAACEAGRPAILATIVGLKDRTGILKLELYPATPDDFTRDDRDLIAEGKTFRRVTVAPPASGPVQLCLRVPGPGRYTLLLTHNRDGRNKFDYRIDGAGVPSNRRLGMSKPKADAAMVEVGAGPLPITIRAQYLGLFGFSPSSAK